MSNFVDLFNEDTEYINESAEIALCLSLLAALYGYAGVAELTSKFKYRRGEPGNLFNKEYIDKYGVEKFEDIIDEILSTSKILEREYYKYFKENKIEGFTPIKPSHAINVTNREYVKRSTLGILDKKTNIIKHIVLFGTTYSCLFTYTSIDKDIEKAYKEIKKNTDKKIKNNKYIKSVYFKKIKNDDNKDEMLLGVMYEEDLPKYKPKNESYSNFMDLENYNYENNTIKEKASFNFGANLNL